MRGKSNHAIIRNNKNVVFTSEDGRSITLNAQDSTRSAWYMAHEGRVIKVEKSAQPQVEIAGVVYKYVVPVKAPRISLKTVDGDNLDAEAKKSIGKDVAKLGEIGKKVLAELVAGGRDRLKVTLENGYQLTIGMPAFMFRKKKTEAV